MTLSFLHTNDLHGMLDASLAQRLAPERAKVHLYFDTGDCVKSGNLTIPLKDEDVWRHLADLRCTASVPGNRESHPLEKPFLKKLSGHQHPVLCANVARKSGGEFLPGSSVFEVEGKSVGVIGAMVPIVTERMATQAVSQLLWTPPIHAVVAEANRLRPAVDVLIALTHIGLTQDQKLAEACPHLDVIFGGHSHSVLLEPLTVNGVAIAQGGSHARFFGTYEFDCSTRQFRGGLVPWRSAS